MAKKKTPAEAAVSEPASETKSAEAAVPAAEEATPAKAKRVCRRKPKTDAAAETVKAEKTDAPAKKSRASGKTKTENVAPFDAIVEAARKKAEKAKYVTDFAAQIDLTGAVQGTLYVECKDGKINVAGFDYKGHDLAVTADSDTFTELMNGKTELPKAVENGKIEMTKAPLSVMLAFKKILF